MAPSTATDTSEPIYFYGTRQTTYGVFSQFQRSGFRDPDYPKVPKFNYAEQYMMYRKAITFNDPDIAAKIAAAKYPNEQKQLGRHVHNFNPKVWDQVKLGIVERGNYLKFTQNENFKQRLLGTGDKLLVEASEDDDIWSIGHKASDAKKVSRDEWGQNLLGIALMNVRKRIRAEDAGEEVDNSDQGATEVEFEEQSDEESDEEPERLPTSTTKKRKHDTITIEDSEDESAKEETATSKKTRVGMVTGERQELRHLFNATKGKHNSEEKMSQDDLFEMLAKKAVEDSMIHNVK
ncbi:hypothetical protein E4T44_08315 [Aureobasidium sp. EXF-8845]|nr:hypothetical protein E4T44_08315 [Aureobasidium sp. EXF-8845]KAI4850625.1 hypothetical protein E4T45_05420 [Aureobasidium sp. EXF-8846]